MNRRTIVQSLIAASASGALISKGTAQTPAASPESASGITLVDVDGAALTLSPDGTMVAGMRDREVICVWDAQTLEAIAESDPLPEGGAIDDTSITWSPDNSALAWSLSAARLLLDSDVYTFDIASSTVTNLTREPGSEEDAPALLGSTDLDVSVDMFPSWSATGDELFFARTPWGNDAPRETRLMRVSRDGGDAAEVALLSDTNAFLVNGPMTAFEDGGILYATWPPNDEDPDHGVFLVAQDGEVDGVSTGILARDAPAMVLVDVAAQARRASAVSLRNYVTLTPDKPIWVELDLDTGIPTPFEEILSLPARGEDDDQSLFAAPAFLTGPGGEVTGYLYATSDARFDEFTLWRHEAGTGSAEEIGRVPNPGPRAPGVLRLPAIEVAANGTAALSFAGNLWRFPTAS